MINRELLDPQSIVVIGGSNNVHKPGGAIVRNILQGGYQGTLRIVNPKEDEVQGIKVFHDANELPPTELAVLVIPAKFCPDTVELLARDKQTRAFIIISAGFGEETKAGAKMEQRILDTCEQYGAALIGPNCIGLLNRQHHSYGALAMASRLALRMHCNTWTSTITQRLILLSNCSILRISATPTSYCSMLPTSFARAVA